MTNVLIFAVLIVLIAIAGFYLFSQSSSLTQTTPSITQTLTSTTSASVVSAQTNFLKRTFYINATSGEGLLWFGNTTVQDVKNGIYAWQYATNNLIQFTETNNSNADIVISFTSGISQNSSTKTIGETYVSEGLIKGSVQIIPQGVPCRNTGIAMHEIGHVIGLEHNQTNRFDIMYPLQSFGCNQNISSYDSQQAEQLIDQLIS